MKIMMNKIHSKGIRFALIFIVMLFVTMSVYAKAGQTVYGSDSTGSRYLDADGNATTDPDKAAVVAAEGKYVAVTTNYNTVTNGITSSADFTVKGGTWDSVYGGLTKNDSAITMSGNVVTIDGEAIITGDVYGAYCSKNGSKKASPDAKYENNTLNIKGGTIGGSVRAIPQNKNKSSNSNINWSGGTVKSRAITGDNVIITGGTFAREDSQEGNISADSRYVKLGLESESTPGTLTIKSGLLKIASGLDGVDNSTISIDEGAEFLVDKKEQEWKMDVFKKRGELGEGIIEYTVPKVLNLTGAGTINNTAIIISDTDTKLNVEGLTINKIQGKGTVNVAEGKTLKTTLVGVADGTLTVNNSGTVAHSITSGSKSEARVVEAVGTSVTVNGGSLDATAMGTNTANATGVYANNSGTITLNNVTQITATATGGTSADAYGIDNEGSSTGTVTGISTIRATGSNANTYGLSNAGNVNVTFSGSGSSINSTSSSNSVRGIYGQGTSTTVVSSLGKIEVNGSLDAYGIDNYAYNSGDNVNATVGFADGGTISATSANSSAYGIMAHGNGTNLTTVTNLRRITANASGASANSYGIYINKATANVSFKGDGGQAITSTAADAANAYSIYTCGTGATNVNLENSILSGKISQNDTSTVKLNFNNSSVWTLVNGDVTGNVTVNLNSGSELDTRKRDTQGKVTTAEAKELTLSGVTIVAASGSKVSFDASASGDEATGTLNIDTINVNESSSGTISLGSVNVLDNATGSWTTAKTSAKLLSATDIQLSGTSTTTTSEGHKYTFTGNTDGTVSAKSVACVYPLPQTIKANPQAAGEADTYSMTEGETMTEALGTLNNQHRSSGKSEFTLNGNGNMLTAAGGTGNGVTINSGDTMTVKNVTARDFAPFATNSGTLNLDGVTFSGTTGNVDVVNSGTLNLYGTNTFNKGIVNNGTLNWNITGGVTTLDWSKLTGSGNRKITVGENQESGSYTLATNATTATGSFTITGISSQGDVSIAIGGDYVKYNGILYKLVIDKGNLVLVVVAHKWTYTVDEATKSIKATCSHCTETRTVYLAPEYFTELTVDVADAEAEKSVIWSTDKPGVASVDENGKVTAVGAGTAKITAVTAVDSSAKDSITINVTAD